VVGFQRELLTEKFVDQLGIGTRDRAKKRQEAGRHQDASAIDALFESRDEPRKLLEFCLWHLGWEASDREAEEALFEFQDKHRSEVIWSYNPGAMSLVGYYKLCLKRFCWKEKKKLEKIRQESFDEALSNDRQFTDGSQGDCEEDMRMKDAALRAREEEEGLVLDGIRRLPADDRELLDLYYEQGLPIKDIATRLHKTKGAVKVNLFRIRKHLRRHWNGNNNG